MAVVRAVVTAGAGFLLAVLWFDLMFDVQARGGPPLLPEAVLASIAGYYRRVTTETSPMGSLVAVVMLVTVLAAVVAVVRDAERRGVRVVAVGLIAPPVVLALLRVVPNAVALGTRLDTPEVQSVLARSILREHVLCFVAVLSFLVLELVLLRRSSAARR